MLRTVLVVLYIGFFSSCTIRFLVGFFFAKFVFVFLCYCEIRCSTKKTNCSRCILQTILFFSVSGLENVVKNMLTSLRAVTELQNPAIRERHWQQLMQVSHCVSYSMLLGPKKWKLNKQFALSYCTLMRRRQCVVGVVTSIITHNLLPCFLCSLPLHLSPTPSTCASLLHIFPPPSGRRRRWRS